MSERKPRIGILGIMQDLYDDMIPGIARRQEGYAAELAAHLADAGEFIPSKPIKYREDAERAMHEFEGSDLDGNAVEQGFTPSSDTATHAYVYRQMPEVGGVVHTHSNYATAWAARGEAVPCVITAMADEFGGEIPLGPFALIGSDEIGRGVVATLTGHRSPAVLMRSHGVFTIGGTARDAVKAAVMCEDAARTVHLARAYGEPAPLPADQVDALYARYQNHYGQRPTLGKE